MGSGPLQGGSGKFAGEGMRHSVRGGFHYGMLGTGRCRAVEEAVSADETAQAVLRLYDGDGARYGAADTQALEFAQYLLGDAEGIYQLTSE